MKRILSSLQRKNGILAWTVCGGMFITNAILAGIEAAFGIILANIASEFHSNRGVVALVPCVHSASMFVAAFISSFLSKKFSFRSLTFAGGIISCLAYLISFYCSDVITLILSFGC